MIICNKRNEIYKLLLLLACHVTTYTFAQTEVTKDTTVQDFAPGPLIKVKAKNNATAYSSVTGDEMYKTTATNLTNTLYGRLTGVTVLQNSGQPGSDAANLFIRGVGTFNKSNLSVFVDGFQVPATYIHYLLPAEIETVSVLKDAAALSTFGMKGANGVLWITTKRGKAGEPAVQLQMRYGSQQPTHINKPLPSYQYAALYNEAYNNDNRTSTWQPYYTTQQINDLKSGKGMNTDWYAQVLKKSAMLNTTDVSVTGGSSAAKYYVVLGHANNNGLYNVQTHDNHSNLSFRQFNLRANLDVNLFKIFEGRVGLSGRTEERKMPNYSPETLWNDLASYPNIIYPAINADGSYAGTTIYPNNPYASIRELGFAKMNDRTLNANVFLKEKFDFITPGLYINQSVSFNTWSRGTFLRSRDYARMINGTPQTLNQNTNYAVNDDYGTNQWNWMQFTGGIGYEKQTGLHHFVSAINYLQSMYIVDANQNENAGINTRYAFQNISGRIHYDYDRLNAELGFAYSGSDNYRAGSRFGLYPSVSVGYSIFNNANKRNFINTLKVRGSAGISGNDYFSGGRYLYKRYYENTGTFGTGLGEPTWVNGLALAYTPNTDFFAEKSAKYNLGIESRFFDNLNITADFFFDRRTGIPVPNNGLSASYGQKVPYVNAGIVNTTGFEISADFSKSVNEFTYSIGGNFSYANPVIKFMDEVAVSPTNTRTGNTAFSIFGYTADGFYNVTDFNADGSLKQGVVASSLGTVVAGDVKYRDIDGNGLIDARDISKIGNSTIPKVTYAAFVNLSYKGIYLNALLQGVSGTSINLLNASEQIIAFANNGNAYAIANNRWAYFPDQNIDTRASATYPRLSLMGNNNNYTTSTIWVKDASFLRIRNIELGYNFPQALFRRNVIKGAKLFLNAVNPITFSKLTKNYGLDPETMTGYPVMKVYALGLTVNF